MSPQKAANVIWGIILLITLLTLVWAVLDVMEAIEGYDPEPTVQRGVMECVTAGATRACEWNENGVRVDE